MPFFTNALFLTVLGQLCASIVTAQSPAVISGRVSHHDADSIRVSWRPAVISNEEKVVSAPISPNGDFVLKVPVGQASAAELRCDDVEANIFLEPGNNLQVRFDVANLTKTLKFKSNDGSASELAANANNYLNDCNQRIFEIEGFQVLPENIGLYEKAFVSFLDYRQRQQQDVFRDAGGKRAFSPAFAAFAQAEIKYLYANDLLAYPALREQVIGTKGKIEVSKKYYDFLLEPELVPGSEEIASSSQYQDFALNYVHYRVQTSGLPSTSPGYYPACYDVAQRTFKGAMRPLAMGRVLLETFSLGHSKHATELLGNYVAQSNAPADWVALLRRKLENNPALTIGAPAPPLPLQTLAGDSLNLAEYRGKLVYVMFWNSRLPQSQRELPYLRQLIKDFAGQPIMFVSADFDQSPNAQLLPEKTGAMESAIVPSSVQNVVRQQYSITNLPAFVLLAEDGTVLDPSPKRLSSHSLREDLHDAFGKAAAYRAVSLGK